MRNENRLIWEAYSKAQDIANIENLKVIEVDPGDGSYGPITILEPPHIDLEWDDLPPAIKEAESNKKYEAFPSKIMDLPLRSILIHQDVVYKESLMRLAGMNLSQIDPILVFHYRGDYHLIDGNHRWALQYMRDPSSSVRAKVYDIESK
jgi:hypothetical protein